MRVVLATRRGGGMDAARVHVIDELVGNGNHSVYMRLKRHLASGAPSLAPSPCVDAIFSALVHALQTGPHSAALYIARAPRLAERAEYIAAAANKGEHLLELHYAPLVLATAHSAPLANAVPADAHTRVRRLAAVAQPFPYVGNYVRLVRAECDLLVTCLRGDLRALAVVGSGPLPLTGALMAAQLGARVMLIDNDEAATRHARLLVRAWERAGALPPGGVCPTCADARKVRFTRTRGAPGIVADCVLVASLVPDEAKTALARGLCDTAWDGVLAVRGAHGLTALANYQRVDRDALSAVLDHVGYAVPAGCVEHGRVAGEPLQPIAVFPADVLNSLEVYVAKSAGERIAKRVRADVLNRKRSPTEVE